LRALGEDDGPASERPQRLAGVVRPAADADLTADPVAGDVADDGHGAQRRSAASRLITPRTRAAAAEPSAVRATPPVSGIDAAASTSAPTPTAPSVTAARTIPRASTTVESERPTSGSSESNASSAVRISPAPTMGAR